MAFWCRMKNSKIKTLSIHLKRCYFQCNVSNSLIANASQPSIRVVGNSSLIIPKSPFGLSQSVRCFAAPVQAKTKKEEKESSGPRLNGEITADVVRLVSEEGHRIVSVREALELARSLNLDLVEGSIGNNLATSPEVVVSGKAKPPVCKIMDYHKEKYQQELKENAKKSKARSTFIMPVLLRCC
ncbi:hypothetical protein T459_32164 [Capsicum annuum]|uniref:Translation initiation factor 3 N-terminal domain-containing protein n=1 Tax=Capsicum annuum TaxID=4072 RepID=A0A2G2Y2R4_CAPAN|nr:hypothetical protein T459_32164 [Capsicum annuum]